jgi:hypothetical protein
MMNQNLKSKSNLKKKYRITLKEKLAEDASEKDTQRLLEFIGVIAKHTKEIKKFED